MKRDFNYVGSELVSIGCPPEPGQESGVCPEWPAGTANPEYYTIINGQPIPRPAEEIEAIKAEREAEDAKVQAEADIRAEGASKLEAIAQPYGKEERETWQTQEKEALEWQADNDADCPMIRALAETRGISMEIMVGKILSNAELFRVASGQILGEQQKKLDELADTQ